MGENIILTLAFSIAFFLSIGVAVSVLALNNKMTSKLFSIISFVSCTVPISIVFIISFYKFLVADQDPEFFALIGISAFCSGTFNFLVMSVKKQLTSC